MTDGQSHSLDKLTLTVHGAGTAPDQLAPIRDLYAEEYTDSEVEALVSGWPRRYGAPNFCLVIAHCDDQLIGYAFGHSLGDSTRWWDGRLEEFPEDAVTEWGGRTFAIIEIIVRSGYRRQGIARRLHTHLIAELTEERITLLVRPSNNAARRAYLAWGYHVVGRIQPFSEGPVFDAMIKPLQQKPD